MPSAGLFRVSELEADVAIIGGGIAGCLAAIGELVLIRSPAVVVATGHATRMYPGVAGSPFNTWHSPYDTGDGPAIAYRAGAAMTNVEFAVATLVPKGYAIPGLAAFMGMDGYLINAAGERFMERYHPLGERAATWASFRTCFG